MLLFGTLHYANIFSQLIQNMDVYMQGRLQGCFNYTQIIEGNWMKIWMKI